jgi:hypothetical protein
LVLHWNRAQIFEQIFAYGKILVVEKPAQQSVPCSDALLDLSSGPT